MPLTSMTKFIKIRCRIRLQQKSFFFFFCFKLEMKYSQVRQTKKKSAEF